LATRRLGNRVLLTNSAFSVATKLSEMALSSAEPTPGSSPSRVSSIAFFRGRSRDRDW
jgi:hypothetical protein